MALQIGLVTGEYPPMEGGVGAFTEALARALHGAGHRVHIVTSRLARPTTERRAPGRLTEPVELGFARLHPRARRWWWRDVNLLADIALRYDLDVINLQFQAAAYNMRHPAIYFAPLRLRGLVPVVVTFHDLRVPYLFPRAGRWRRWVVERLAGWADGVVATNEADYRALTGRTRRLVEIPIGSNIPVYRPAAADVAAVRAKLGLSAGHCLLGYFGFLNESKGADDLIRALAQLGGDTHLVFIGGRTGASDQANNQAFLLQLETLIGRLGLTERVHWTDFLPAAAVSAHLLAADILVMPYRDGVSLRRGTLMAGLAHGRPLISTRATPTPPALNHGENIWLVPPADPDALAEAVNHLAGDPERRSHLGQGAATLSLQFSWDEIATRTVAFYQRVRPATAEN